MVDLRVRGKSRLVREPLQPLAGSATEIAAELRDFLTNMARATREGESIGSTGEDAGAVPGHRGSPSPPPR